MKKPLVAVFSYTSVCCGAPGKKAPCVKDVGEKRDGKSVSQSPLGHWRCSQCRKACKVKRGRNAEQTENGAERNSLANGVGSTTADTV